NLTDSEIYAYDVPIEVNDHFPYYLSGYDEEGAPIFIVEGGKWDMRKYVEQGGKHYDVLDIYIDRMILNFRDSGLNSTAKQFVIISDMDGFSIRQAGHVKTVQFMISKFVRFEQIVRSGTLKRAWGLNVNVLFERIWQIGRHILGQLENYIEIFGTNPEKWKPKLLKQLPRDQIPECSSNLTDSEIYDFGLPVEMKEQFIYYLSGYDEEGVPSGKMGREEIRGASIRQAGHGKSVQFMISNFVRFEKIARSGTMKRAWILNANALFEGIWQIGSRILGQLANTVEFVSVLLLLFWATLVTSSNLTDSEILAFDAPAEIKSSFPYYLSGYDEDGAPIWVFELGKWDMRKFAEQGGKLYDAMDIYGDQMFLNFKKSGLSSPAKQFVGICDMDGFQVRQAGHAKTVQFILSKFVRFEQIVRDGAMKQGWIVNANALWGTIWKLGSPLLGALANSIEVFGANKNAWIPKLLKHLPRDQISEWYGGLPNHKPVKLYIHIDVANLFDYK
ncbi:unnamed protein product, partial [Allacma fusca]